MSYSSFRRKVRKRIELSNKVEKDSEKLRIQLSSTMPKRFYLPDFLTYSISSNINPTIQIGVQGIVGNFASGVKIDTNQYAHHKIWDENDVITNEYSNKE